ncbi:Protein LOW PSII ACCUMULATION 2 like [Actinidia chinensis var. chinensis]|uniref:Protein LOW PSII ACCUMULATION 2 like n=1 Tax=Actinidia chinensis var. chinensis TaxID=1590841 RepID=A0A2R6PM10_ACTCC|nr:Protein LOW PSII ACCUMULATION 2 like [Actinidia chinensis var. chinensis]
MALTLHSSPFLLTQKPHLLLHTKTTPFAIKSQDSSSTSNPSSPSTDPPKPTSQGLGFGSSSSNSPKPKPNPVGIKKKQRGKGERASIIRRAPVEKPEFVSQQEEPLSKEQIRNENAFLLAWLGLGGVILVEGIALAASGFLPEEWDKLFVKYLYPSFTPTVFLFVAGTVGYGVLKYLQNEELKNTK